MVEVELVFTNFMRGGKNGSLYSCPSGRHLLAIACKIVSGLRSEALPIRKFNEPGCITIIVLE